MTAETVLKLTKLYGSIALFDFHVIQSQEAGQVRLGNGTLERDREVTSVSLFGVEVLFVELPELPVHPLFCFHGEIVPRGSGAPTALYLDA